MSCYHPLVGLWTGNYTENGKKEFRIDGNLDPVFANKHFYGSVTIPCGHCLGCRIDYSRNWADRMMLELDSNNGKGIFITLTYECRNVVDRNGNKVCKCVDEQIKDTKKCPRHDVCLLECRNNGSLFKRHVQLFMKSLRKELATEGIRVRFFCTGEYGDLQKSHRPHYHIVLFGIGLDDLKNKIPVGFNELRQEVYTHPLISNHWPYGFVSIGDVSWRSCAYVARYVVKKAMDPSSELVLDMMDKEHMFSLMSRRPGIGKPYIDEHPDCLDLKNIPIDGKKISIPKYFIKLLDYDSKDKNGNQRNYLYNPEKYASICAERKKFASDAFISELSKQDLDPLSYLEVKERVKEAQIRALRRYV